jgi:deazaflavin-dependent oxidoreductase (nitroreductase family)
MTNDQVIDSPQGWVNEHIQRYVATGGKDGHEWKPGVPTLLLTTTGNKSGLRRRTALIYARDGENYLIVASQGGAPTHPAWYRNLDADPAVHLQVGADEFDATARTATDAERDRLWPLVTAVWPAYDDYQRKTDRQIPVVVLHPVR